MLLFLQLLYTKDFQVSYNLAKDKTTVWEILIYINNKIRGSLYSGVMPYSKCEALDVW